MLSRKAHQKLRREFEAAQRDRNPARFLEDFRDGLAQKHARPEDFRIRWLFEEFMEDGHELAESFNPNYGGSNVELLEAGGPVNTGHFANIMGQIMYTRVLDEYNAPGYIGDMLCTTIPTNFDGEKIPGMGEIGDEVEIVTEGKPYPTAGFGEEWIETPSTIKRGLICEVTKEAVFFDRTGLVLKRAGDVGKSIRVNKEKRQLDMALGITTAYRRNGAAAVATYGDAGTHPFGDNLAASNTLVDWTDIEAAQLLFDALTDPNTGEPIAMPTTLQLVVPTALNYTARRIVNATQIFYGIHGDTSASTVGQSSNPLAGVAIEVISSPYVKARTSSASTYFIGDFKKAFAYMENWPLKVIPAAANSYDEYHRDVVASWKVTERGAAAVIAPYYVVKCT